MLYVELPEKQTVTLSYDRNTERYPILTFKEEGVTVMKITINTSMLPRVLSLLEQARDELRSRGALEHADRGQG
ncbi:MAG: hypothetical protein ACXWQR_04930 [Ktedonobacterales bacterium]